MIHNTFIFVGIFYLIELFSQKSMDKWPVIGYFTQSAIAFTIIGSLFGVYCGYVAHDIFAAVVFGFSFMAAALLHFFKIGHIIFRG